MKTILLIEDDLSIIKGLSYFLSKQNFNVVSIKSKEELIKLNNKNIDLVILDIMLSDCSGFDLIKYVKENICNLVIFLTAMDDEDAVVKGFDLGADDYVIKPFRSRELLSRINRILNANYKDVIIIKNVKLDKLANKVFVDQNIIEFTALEFKILLMLFENAGTVVTRELILSKIWDESGSFVNDNTLTVYIKRIRSKLPNDIIKTIKNVGYIVDKE